MEEIEDDENEDLVIFECEPIAKTIATWNMQKWAWRAGQLIRNRYDDSTPPPEPPSELTLSGKKWVKYFRGSTSLDDLDDSEELKFKSKVENFLNALEDAKVWKFSTQRDLNNAYKWGLFHWNKIPGKHNKKLKKFLRNNFNVDWVKSFKKSRDNKSITASEGENDLLITLDKETATLTIDSKTDETFKVKMLRIVIDRGYAITSTYRPKERSYLMHYSWKIAKANKDPKNVPGFEGDGVNIEWWHGDQDTSIKAAKEMIEGYKIRGGAALKSRHNSGKAIDLVLRWRGVLNIKNNNEEPVLITSPPRSHKNKELWKVAESYEVIHFKCSEKRIKFLMKRKIMKKRDPWHEKLCIRGEFQHWSDDGS
jgi:hypothetical protein